MAEIPVGRGVLRFTPELLVELLKGGLPRRLEVVDHALPADATLVSVDCEGRDVRLVLESATFPSGITDLPEPHLCLVESDAQIVHDAGRLRAALLTVLNDDAHLYPPEFPSWVRDLLAETERYQLPTFTFKGADHV